MTDTPTPRAAILDRITEDDVFDWIKARLDLEKQAEPLLEKLELGVDWKGRSYYARLDLRDTSFGDSIADAIKKAKERRKERLGDPEAKRRQAAALIAEAEALEAAALIAEAEALEAEGAK